MALSPVQEVDTPRATPAPEPEVSDPSLEVQDDDVANVEQEAFDVGMRQNAIGFAVADADADNKLDFDEFCALVRDREDGEHTEAELRARFEYLDGDHSGKVDMHEYLRFALRDALSRSAARVIEIFQEWDEDGSGHIDKREFRRAIRSLGFEQQADADIDLVFEEFDADGSGTLEYAELNKKLRQFSGLEAVNKHALRRVAGGRMGAALSTRVKLDHSANAPPIAHQLRDILAKESVRVVDLFRDWDEDGNGLIDKNEFRRAMPLIGITMAADAADALFDSWDVDGSGQIEYSELNKLLRRTVGASEMRAQRRKKKARGILPPAGAAAYGGKADNRYGGARFYGGVTKSAAWDASYDAVKNEWHLPALERRYRGTIDDANEAWLMPMRAANGRGNWRNQPIIQKGNPYPRAAARQIAPPMPMYGGKFAEAGVNHPEPVSSTRSRLPTINFGASTSRRSTFASANPNPPPFSNPMTGFDRSSRVRIGVEG